MYHARALWEAGLVRSLPFVLTVGLSAAACSGGTGGAAAAATGDGAIVVTVTSSAVTVENKSGTSLENVQVNIIPVGVSRPYFQLPMRMYNNEKKTFPLETFRMQDGMAFRPNATKARTVKVTGKDLMGKEHQTEVPFQ